MDFFLDPRKLPCNHIFCRHCLEKLYNHKDCLELKCPYCRYIVDVSNTPLESLETPDFEETKFQQLYNKIRSEINIKNDAKDKQILDIENHFKFLTLNLKKKKNKSINYLNEFYQRKLTGLEEMKEKLKNFAENTENLENDELIDKIQLDINEILEVSSESCINVKYAVSSDVEYLKLDIKFDNYNRKFIKTKNEIERIIGNNNLFYGKSSKDIMKFEIKTVNTELIHNMSGFNPHDYDIRNSNDNKNFLLKKLSNCEYKIMDLDKNFEFNNIKKIETSLPVDFLSKDEIMKEEITCFLLNNMILLYSSFKNDYLLPLSSLERINDRTIDMKVIDNILYRLNDEGQIFWCTLRNLIQSKNLTKNQITLTKTDNVIFPIKDLIDYVRRGSFLLNDKKNVYVISSDHKDGNIYSIEKLFGNNRLIGHSIANETISFMFKTVDNSTVFFKNFEI